MKVANLLVGGIAASMVLCGTLLNADSVLACFDGGNIELAALPEKMHSSLLGSFSFKDSFLTLNGGCARILRMRRCNGVYKLPNGHLIRPFPRAGQKWRAEKIAELAALASANGSRFVFALLPNKIVYGGRMMPSGWAPGNDALYDNSDELLERCRKLNLDVLDTRKTVCPTEAAVLERFFRTDHHWNAYGAFCASGYLAKELISRIGVAGDAGKPLEELDAENWESRGLNRRRKVFLGSDGRRTGPWFAGYDTDYAYLVPKFNRTFEHKYRSRGHHKPTVKKGSFNDTMIAEKAAGEPESCYKDMAYSVYYTDLAESFRHCGDAPVKARLLIIKDSYAIPLLAFMSTVFSDVYAIDLRYDPHKDIAGFIKELHPDVVVMMYNPSSFLSEKNKLWIW